MPRFDLRGKGARQSVRGGPQPIKKQTNPGKLGQNAYCRLVRFPVICGHAKPELA
jgi:hypothetical protein